MSLYIVIKLNDKKYTPNDGRRKSLTKFAHEMLNSKFAMVTT